MHERESIHVCSFDVILIRLMVHLETTGIRKGRKVLGVNVLLFPKSQHLSGK